MKRAASRLVGAISNSGRSTAGSTRAWLQPCGKQALSSAAESACATASVSRQLPASTSGRVLDAVLLALRQQRHSCAPANFAGPQLKEFRRQIQARWQTLEDRLVLVSNSLWTTGAGQKLMSVGIPMLLAELYTSQRPASQCLAVAPASLATNPKHSSALPIHILLTVLHTLAEELLTMMRAVYLTALFTPVFVTLPLANIAPEQRTRWLELVRWTLERAGPAFIKWGQWAATRPDLFPPDLCTALETLQSVWFSNNTQTIHHHPPPQNAPEHPWSHTRAVIGRAFGVPLEAIFSDFALAPVASGSIAQVYRATLSKDGAAGTGLPAGTVVAVKVRHPGVATVMHRDFALMQRAAMLASHLPGLKQLQLQESIRQFGAPLKEQLDLAREAQHLARFNHNFRLWTNLSFPVPIFPLVSPDVLVESFEEGCSISAYVKNPGRHTRPLADLGMNCYLKMLLKDNFVHADMHPGNILVRFDNARTLIERLGQMLKRERIPHLVLLDTGMIAELSARDKDNLVNFFKAVTCKDGAMLARRILEFAPDQPCATPEAFEADMKQLFDGLTADHITTYTSEVIGEVMERVRTHNVALRGSVSTIVVTTMVLEGWSTKLNPDIKIMESLREVLPMKWSERISQTADRVITRHLLPGTV